MKLRGVYQCSPQFGDSKLETVKAQLFALMMQPLVYVTIVTVFNQCSKIWAVLATMPCIVPLWFAWVLHTSTRGCVVPTTADVEAWTEFQNYEVMAMKL